MIRARSVVVGVVLGLATLYACVGRADSPPGVQVQDEAGGSPAGVRKIIFAGTPITCVVSAGVATCTVTGGGGSFAVTEYELDCGNAATLVCKATVTDAGVSASSNVVAWQSGEAATGRQADEAEFADLTCKATPGSGSFLLTCSSPTFVHGKFKVYYAIG